MKKNNYISINIRVLQVSIALRDNCFSFLEIAFDLMYQSFMHKIQFSTPLLQGGRFSCKPSFVQSDIFLLERFLNPLLNPEKS